MIDYKETLEIIGKTRLSSLLEVLPKQVEESFTNCRWGLQSEWQAAYDSLPEVRPSIIDLDQAAIKIGCAKDCNAEQLEQLNLALKELHPWRKGPFNIFDIQIDTEWRSDMKWNRLKHHISDLKDRFVLDIGCGSGYHCWRMKGAGAKFVVGVEPMLKYIYQFYSFQKYIQDPSVAVFPMGIEHLPENIQAFDTVFSMGVFYHRKSPFEHLVQLKTFLKPGGELVLETLVIDGPEGQVLVPQDRYAQMRNVWFLPSVATLIQWLRRSNYKDIRCVDVNVTSLAEQRSTEWMTFQSLADFLDPKDQRKTIEGYPAPKRAIIIART